MAIILIGVHGGKVMGSFYRGLVEVRGWNRGVDTGGGGGNWRGRGAKVGRVGYCL
jgi:hypothetical protein